MNSPMSCLHNRTQPLNGISPKNESSLSKLKRPANRSISIKKLKKFKLLKNMEPKYSNKSVNIYSQKIKLMDRYRGPKLLFNNPINFYDSISSWSKRNSMRIIKTKSQNFIGSYNLKKEDENFKENVFDHSSLNVIENNIKNAINNMRIKFEKTKKNQTNSPKNKKVTFNLKSNNNQIFHKKTNQKRILSKKTIAVIQPKKNIKFFKKIAIKQRRKNSFDINEHSKKRLFKNIKKYINKNFRKRCYTSDSDNFSENDNQYISKGFSLSFHPDSKFIFIFDLLMIIADLYSFISIPLHIAKAKDIREENESFIKEISYYFVDLIFLCDFILNFFRGYYNFEMKIIRNNKNIIIHYFKKYFFMDLIESIPIYSIIRIILSKNNEIYFGQSNIKLNILTILLFIKPFKIFKIIKKKQNKALEDFYTYLSNNFYLEHSFNFIIYFLIFFLFVHLFICLHIYLAYESYPNWLTNTKTINKTFFTKYITSFYFMITTMTTVGYGDIVSVSFIERIYHIFLLVISTLLYSFLVSKIANYLRDSSHDKIKLSKDLTILEGIRISYPTIPFKLYSKIKRHLFSTSNKRKKTGISILINGVPDAYKKDLLIKIYSNVINGFNIFKEVNNSNFIYNILTSFIPIQAKKEEIIILEGEFIENIVFVKDGRVSMEISIDLNDPYNSIQKYLEKNFIGISRKEELQNYNYMNRVNSVLTVPTKDYNDIKTKIDNIINNPKDSLINHSKINNHGISVDLGRMDFSRNIAQENYRYIKIFDIRKNEHYGDIHLFLDQRSPFTLIAKSRIVELLLLRKIDAINISKTFPNICRRIQNKSFHNLVSIKNIVYKKLKRYYDTYLFNKQKKSLILDFNTTKNSLENNGESFSKISKIEGVKTKSFMTKKNKKKRIMQTPSNNENKKKNPKKTSTKILELSLNSHSFQSSNLNFTNSLSSEENKEPIIDINNNNYNFNKNFLTIKSNKDLDFKKDSDIFTFNNGEITESNKNVLGLDKTGGTKFKSTSNLQINNLIEFNDNNIKNDKFNSYSKSSFNNKNKLLSNESIQYFNNTQIINDNDSKDKAIVTLENMNENFSKKIKKNIRKRKKIQKIRLLMKLQKFKADKNLIELYLQNNQIERKQTRSNNDNSTSSSNNKILSEILDSTNSEINNSIFNKVNNRFNENKLKIIPVESFEIKFSYNNINILSKGQMVKNIKYKNFIENLIGNYLCNYNSEDIFNKIISIFSQKEKNFYNKKDILIYSDIEKETNNDKISEVKLPLVNKANNQKFEKSKNISKNNFKYNNLNTLETTENLKNTINEEKLFTKTKQYSNYLEKEFKNFGKLNFENFKFQNKDDIINKMDLDSNINKGLEGKLLYKSKKSKNLNKDKNNDMKGGGFENYLNKIDGVNKSNYSKNEKISLFIDKNNDISQTNMINIKNNNNEKNNNICIIY